MSTAGLMTRMFAAFEDALHHGLHGPPPRTVPAAEDWPEWHHYDPTPNSTDLPRT